MARAGLEKCWPFFNLFPTFAGANCARACSDCFALTELTQLAGRAKVFIWRKVDLAKSGAMLSKKVDRLDTSPGVAPGYFLGGYVPGLQIGTPL